MSRTRFRAIFFDLDHTLWDFEKNSAETILGLLHDTGMDSRSDFTPEEFLERYRRINRKMWDDYHAGLIDREQLRENRFIRCFREFGLSDEARAAEFSRLYLQQCPEKTAVFPGTFELLDWLRPQHSLHIITNGFRETQIRKLKHSGLAPYFDSVHISEEIGWKKPEPEIFLHALKCARVQADESTMIGDNLDTDIAGAVGIGMHAVLFDPEAQYKPGAGYGYVQTLAEIPGHLQQLSL